MILQWDANQNVDYYYTEYSKGNFEPDELTALIFLVFRLRGSQQIEIGRDLMQLTIGQRLEMLHQIPLLQVLDQSFRD